MITSAQIQDLKTSVDLLSLAERHSDLKKIAGSEYAGPCPKCGGRDRFHVNTKTQHWMCRNCTGEKKWGDVIEFVRFTEDVDFVTACQSLSTGALRTVAPARPRPPEKKRERWRSSVWQREAFDILDQAAATLDTDAGTPGRAYLEQRGIDVYTSRVWLLGYVEVSPPWSEEQLRRIGGPSITLPYIRHDTDDIMAVRYRRIRSHEERYINEAGSTPVLFGLHLVNLNADTLIVVEGELNAISIWQAAHELGVTVVSIGSQHATEQQLAWVSRLSQRFPRCVVWCDDAQNALKLRAAAKSSVVVPLRSPWHDGEKVDANDMLQRGVLRAFIERTLRMQEAAQ